MAEKACQTGGVKLCLKFQLILEAKVWSVSIEVVGLDDKCFVAFKWLKLIGFANFTNFYILANVL